MDDSKTNLIVVPETREEVTEVKKGMKKKKNKLQELYQEKVVDTGASDAVDKAIDVVNKVEQFGIGAIGTLATVGLVLCPADGPIGEACSAISTTGLIALCKAKKNLEMKLWHSAKGAFEDKIMQVDKKDGNVVAYNDAGEVMTDFMNMFKDVEKVGKSLSNSQGEAA